MTNANHVDDDWEIIHDSHEHDGDADDADPSRKEILVQLRDILLRDMFEREKRGG